MKISEFNYPRPYPNDNTLPVSSSYQEVKSSFNQENAIKLTTKDGDVVTISQSYGSSFDLSSSHTSMEGRQLQTFTTASLQYETFNFQVEGDLDEEELEDIKHLFKDLFKIAGNFFNGDMEKAFKGVDKLDKHMGTISEVSASFSRSKTISTYSNNYHPMANFQDKLADSFQKLDEFVKDDDIINEMLKAQWGQIADMLDLHNYLLDEDNSDTPIVEMSSPSDLIKPISPEYDNSGVDEIDDDDPQWLQDATVSPENFTKLKNNSMKHAEKMMQRIADTLVNHPRLSPFAVPLAERAIDESSKSTKNLSENFQYTNQLKNDFMQQFDKWFFD